MCAHVRHKAVLPCSCTGWADVSVRFREEIVLMSHRKAFSDARVYLCALPNRERSLP
jgi:hypothetical protein